MSGRGLDPTATATPAAPRDHGMVKDDLDRQIDEQAGCGRQYTLLLLWAGPNRTPDDPNIEALQRSHLRHLFTLRHAGQLLVNGPALDAGDLVGLGIFDDVDLEAVSALAAADPAVCAGRLCVDVRPWFGIPGDSI